MTSLVQGHFSAVDHDARLAQLDPYDVRRFDRSLCLILSRFSDTNAQAFVLFQFGCRADIPVISAPDFFSEDSLNRVESALYSSLVEICDVAERYHGTETAPLRQEMIEALSVIQSCLTIHSVHSTRAPSGYTVPAWRTALAVAANDIGHLTARLRVNSGTDVPFPKSLVPVVDNLSCLDLGGEDAGIRGGR